MGGAGILGLVLLVALVVFVIVWTVKGFRKTLRWQRRGAKWPSAETVTGDGVDVRERKSGVSVAAEPVRY